MKKILLFMCAALTAVQALAYDFESNGICYNIKNGKAEVTYQAFMKPANYAGLTDVVIPATVTYNNRQYNVTSIGDLAFVKSAIKSVSIPSSMTQISASSFTGCEIESLTLNTSSVGTAFNYMTSIKTLTLNNGTENLTNEAFEGCAIENLNFNITTNINYSTPVRKLLSGSKTLKSVTFGNGVVVIPEQLLRYCTNLEMVNLSSTVTKIESFAFGNTGLKKLVLPEGVVEVESFAFENCANLKEVTLPSSLVWKPSALGQTTPNGFYHCHAIGNKDAFYDCPIETLTINTNNIQAKTEPNAFGNISVTHTFDWFQYMTSLKTVTFGPEVTKIPGSMFEGCTNLETIILPATVAALGGDESDLVPPFKDCVNGRIIYAGSSIANWGNRYQPCAVSTNTVISDDGYPYTVVNASSVAVSSLTANILKRNGATLYEIPTTVKIGGTDYTVTGIAADAFKGCDKLRSVTIPSTVTAIGSNAFSGCTLLSGIELPEGLTIVGPKAFIGCSSLSQLTIPSTLTSMGANAFAGCYAIETLMVNSNKIGTVFAELDQLNNLTIGSSVSGNISATAFKDCQIENLIVNSNYIGTAFQNKKSLRNITFGSNVTSIPANAFSGCTGLSTVEIPATVTEIGDNAFAGVKNVKYLGTNVPQGKPWGALSSDGDADEAGFVYTDNTKTNIKVYLGTASNVVIPDGVTTISENAFSNCIGMTSITIPASVTSVGLNAFSGCTSLTKAEFASIKSLCGISFNDHNYTSNPLYYAHHLYIGGTEITDLVIPDDVTTINKIVFAGCSGLTSVTIPDNTTSIGLGAFYGCSGITALTLSKNINKIEVGTFENCGSLTTVDIPNSVTTISQNAFTNCSQLAYLNIPASVTTIGQKAFADCKDLVVVTIPKTVTTINTAAFANCLNAKLYCEVAEADKPSGWNANWYNGNSSNIKWGTYFFVKDYIPYTITSENPRTVEVSSQCKNIINSLNIIQVDIPNTVTINGMEYSVTSIATAAFSSCENIESVTIGNNVKTINEAAFQKCKALTTVTIGNSVETIGISAFLDCASLTSITLPNSVTSVGGKAFEGCTSLKTATLSNSLTTIPRMFYGCYELESVEIPSSVTIIEDNAFYGCSRLKLLTIPSGVTSIKGSKAFKNVIRIKNNSSYTTSSPWGALHVVGAEYENGDFLYSDADHTNLIGYIGDGGNVIIPEGVETIGSNIFAGYDNIGMVTVPSTVEDANDINSNAFNLARVVNCSLGGDNDKWGAYIKAKYIDADNFVYEDEAHTVLLMYCGNGTNVTVPNTVRTISRNAFNGCKSLVSITVQSGVTSIGEQAFYNCANLKTVTLPSSLESIGNDAFWDCVGLTTVNIADGVTSIGSGAFQNCKSLQSITIPNSVTSMGSSVFSNCQNLTSATLSNQITTISTYMFSNCRRLNSITIPNSVTKIGTNAFYNCKGLKSIIIPSSVETLEYYAFMYSGLTSISFSKGLKTIEYDVFSGCYELTSVDIPSTVTSIGKEAFRYCKKMVSATIPNSVTEIGQYAFSYSPNLTVYCAMAESDKPDDWLEGWYYNIKGVQWNFWHLDAVADDNSHGSVTGAGMYNNGDKATLNAVPATGYYFTGWDNGIDWTPYKMDVTGNVTITANFAINTYRFAATGANGTVTITTAANEDGTYNHGPVTITAEADENYHFVRWSNGATEANYTLNLVSDSVITAVFEGNAKTVAAAATSTNGTVSGAGSYAYGTEATIEATPAANYHFVQWSNGVKANPYTLKVTNDTAVNAEFAINTFNVMVATEANGAVSAGRAIVAYGDTTKLRAIPVEHYHLASWSNGGTESPSVITVTSDTLVIAEFAIDSHKISLSAENGTVSGAGDYTYGSTVTISATAAKGYKFIKWSDGVTADRRDVVVVSDSSLTAQFEAIVYTVTIGTPEHGEIKGDGSGKYAFGKVIKLTPVANVGYHFAGWSDGNTDNPRELTVDGDLEITAKFAQSNYTVSVTAEHGKISGAADSYKLGATIELTATPDEGYHFTKWSDGNTDNPRTILVTAELVMNLKTQELSFTALFEADENGGENGGENQATAIGEQGATLNIYAFGNTIVVENADAEIRIYDSMGRLVDRDVDNSIRAVFQMTNQGIYIVKVGGTAKRVLVD